MSEENEKAAGWCGCIMMVAIAFGAWKVYGCYEGSKNDRTETEKRAIENEKKANEAKEAAMTASQMEERLSKFAKEYTPALQHGIDRYEEQIKKLSMQRDEFAAEMHRLGVDPNTRLAYKRKVQVIEKMTTDRETLLETRKETYIRWKELQLVRDTAATKEEQTKLLKDAENAAKTAEEVFDKYMKQAEDGGTAGGTP